MLHCPHYDQHPLTVVLVKLGRRGLCSEFTMSSTLVKEDNKVPRSPEKALTIQDGIKMIGNHPPTDRVRVSLGCPQQ
ncbi:unnamed protein product [Cuscuta campestris]|uniref:Uncharacterized protein n=1 Tax=Cuscuta campestris TaxID=132261 RepID=A0A484KP39_9ASTE|nr:unnamed protein product [Cuscuta campestris]